MIEITGTAQHRSWADGTLPPVEQVRPGLWSIPVPLPNHPLRYVLVYAFELPGGLAIVDAGWDSPPSWTALTEGLVTAGGSISDVQLILITHVHPDHYGMAGRIRDASGAAIALHRLEAETLPSRLGGPDVLLERAVDWLHRAGASRDDALAMNATRDVTHLMRMVEPDRLLDDGERLDLPGWELRAVWTPGHTPGHLCFHEERTGVLLAGDHVLPRISPNIAAHAQQQHPDPLRAFLDSLRKVRELPVGEVLPAHEYRFGGLAGRVEDLLAHHEERLAELLGLVGARPGSTTIELAERLTWRRQWTDIRDFHRRMAIGETLAHLQLLLSRGQLEPAGGPVDRWVLRQQPPVG